MYEMVEKPKMAVNKKVFSHESGNAIQQKQNPFSCVDYGNSNIIVQRSAEQLAINKAIGKSVEELASSQIPKAIVAEQVHIDAGGTIVIADFVGTDDRVTFTIYEIKASSTAPLTHNQKIAYPYIFAHGGTIISKDAIAIFGTNQLPAGTDTIRAEPD